MRHQVFFRFSVFAAVFFTQVALIPNQPVCAETTTFTGYPTYWLGREGAYRLARTGAMSGADSESPRTVQAASAELTFDPVNGGDVTGRLVLTVSGLRTICKLEERGPVTWEYVREFTGTYDPNTQTMSGTAVWKPTLVSNEDPEEPNCPEPGPKPELSDHIWQIRFTYPAGLSDDADLDSDDPAPFVSPVNPESGGIIAIWGVPNRAIIKAGVLAVVWNPEATGCEVKDIEGAFEPCQGVFQNDYTFADKLVKLSPNRYRADLDMVKRRPTRLVGIRGPNPKDIGLASIADPNRNEIVIRGKANGTTDVDVQLCFFVKQGSSKRKIFEGKVFQLPFGRPFGDFQTFKASQNVVDGIPVPPDSPYFTFQRTGDYEIVGELVRVDGKPTRVSVSVEGKVVETQSMEIHFVPAVISDEAAQIQEELKTFTHELADMAEKRIPDYFPLAPGGIEAVKFPRVEDARRFVDDFAFEESIDYEVDLRTRLNDLMRTGGLLSGADRVIVVLAPEDMSRVYPFLEASGYSPTKRVIYIEYPEADPNEETVFSVAHELIHTLPYHWSGGLLGGDIGSECGIDFHNYGGDKAWQRIAHGLEITRNGSASGVYASGARKKVPIMAGQHVEKWITQCTYMHLLKELSKPAIDPEVILIRGLIDRNDVPVQGRLFPAYQLDSFLDLESGDEGDWAIILRDSSGTPLGRFGFTPDFDVAYPEEERTLSSFGYRIPALPDVTQIDLLGPGDEPLDSVFYGAAPTVAMLTPLDSNDAILESGGTVHLEWTGDDVDGDTLLYSILYATASPWSWSGNTWQTLSFEQADTWFDVPVDQTHYRDYPHAVRVLATDGTQSAADEVEFTLVRCLDHATAQGIYEDIQRPRFRTDAFSITDPQAVSWVKIGPMTTTHVVEWNWYSPQGDLYLYDGPVTIGEVGQSHDDWPVWSQIDIADADAGSLPGDWTVEIFVDGRPLVTETFLIQ